MTPSEASPHCCPRKPCRASIFSSRAVHTGLRVEAARMTSLCTRAEREKKRKEKKREEKKERLVSDLSLSLCGEAAVQPDAMGMGTEACGFKGCRL